MPQVAPDHLTRFETFRSLNADTVRMMCRHVSLVDVPGNRWLVRRGRALVCDHFLVAGTLEALDPHRIIRAGEPAAALPVAPGRGGLRTRTDSRLLRLSEEGRRLLGERDGPELIRVVEGDDGWQIRFLSSHLLADLDPAVWQQILSRVIPLPVAAGEDVCREGDRQGLDSCYIVASGRVEVRRGGRPVCSLGPGELFGEDALIGAQPRNATVRAVGPGVVMRLEADAFRKFLLSALLSGGFSDPRPGGFRNPERRPFHPDRVGQLRDAIAGLDPCAEYLIDGTSSERSALALFLMRKRGLRASFAASD
jgi:CRP-like cAMP-binding protein